MRDERTLKDVCVEAIVTLVLIRILYPDQVGCRRLGSLLQLHRSRYGIRRWLGTSLSISFPETATILDILSILFLGD